jgi:hypothetical protein
VKKNHDIRLIHKVIFCFTPISSAFAPYPIFEWYPQSNKILLNPGMICIRLNSNNSSCTGRTSENISSSSAGAQENETQDETQFTTKIGGKFSLCPNYFLL